MPITDGGSSTETAPSLCAYAGITDLDRVDDKTADQLFAR